MRDAGVALARAASQRRQISVLALLTISGTSRTTQLLARDYGVGADR
jgi:hypothetical protein